MTAPEKTAARKRPSAAERTASALILLALAAIAAAVWMRQGRLSPALLAEATLDQAPLPAPAADEGPGPFADGLPEELGPLSPPEAFDAES